MTDQSPPPVIKRLIVPLDAERAFRLFTSDMDSWWPFDSHSLTGERPPKFDPPRAEGDEVAEILPDGTRHVWGTVTEWRAGRRFAMTWHVGRQPDRATQVSVDFETVADGTQVTLVHDGWPVLGAEASTIQANYASGWTMVLGQFKASCCPAPVV